MAVAVRLFASASAVRWLLFINYYSLFKGYCNVTRNGSTPSTKVTMNQKQDKENFDILWGFHRGLQQKKSLSTRSATGC